MTNDLRAIVHTPLIHPSPLERYRPNPSRHARHGDLVLTAGGLSGPDYNAALVLGPVPPDTVFAQADAFFAGTGGYSVVVEVETAREMDTALRRDGWEVDEEEPALALPTIPPAVPAPPPDLTIRRVTTDAGFADFMAVSRTGSYWIPSLAAATDPAVALFVGYCDGVPVAVSRITCYPGNPGVGDINGVATADAFRRRGFGTALTWAAIAEGARRGCTAMTLNATEMGYPVYLRMGFQPVCTYRAYVPPEAPQ